MAANVPRDHVADSGILQKARGRVAQTMEAQFVLLASHAMTFAGFLKRPRLRESSGHKNLIKLFRQITVEVILGVAFKGTGKKRLFWIVARWQRLKMAEQRFAKGRFWTRLVF